MSAIYCNYGELYCLFIVHMYTDSVGYGGIAITYYILSIIKDLESPSILLGKMSNLLGVAIFLESNFYPRGGHPLRYLSHPPTILVLLKLQCLLVRSGVSTSIGAGLWVYVGTALVRPTATSKRVFPTITARVPRGDPRRRSVGEHPF